MSVRAYIACSLDGYIAGAGDDLSWLPQPGQNGGASLAEVGEQAGTPLTYEAFIAEVGVLLMGRRTFDKVCSFGEWPYQGVPVLVATHRELPPVNGEVRSAQGTIGELLETAGEIAGGKDIYLDGGQMLAQGLLADAVDEWVVTVVPVVLGEGVQLFPQGGVRKDFEFIGHHSYLGMVQLHFRPKRSLG